MTEFEIELLREQSPGSIAQDILKLFWIEKKKVNVLLRQKRKKKSQLTFQLRSWM